MVVVSWMSSPLFVPASPAQIHNPSSTIQDGLHFIFKSRYFVVWSEFHYINTFRLLYNRKLSQWQTNWKLERQTCVQWVQLTHIRESFQNFKPSLSPSVSDVRRWWMVFITSLVSPTPPSLHSSLPFPLEGSLVSIKITLQGQIKPLLSPGNLGPSQSTYLSFFHQK